MAWGANPRGSPEAANNDSCGEGATDQWPQDPGAEPLLSVTIQIIADSYPDLTWIAQSTPIPTFLP